MGTNWLSQKLEFSIYLKLVNNVITEKTYTEQLNNLNPAIYGPAIVFRDIFQGISDFIRCRNPKAKILVSAIIPRKWDHERRHLVCISYNNILKILTDGKDVFFVQSYSPFLTARGI